MNSENRSLLRLPFFALLLCALFLFSQSGNARAEENGTSAPLCRFGANSAHSADETIANFDLSPLRLGWYIDYRATAKAFRANGIKYAPMIRLLQINPIDSTGVLTYTYSPKGQALIDAIAANPNADWFIGNEPDRRALQDDMEPALYATAFHELRQLIKGKDPTARFFAGSIVQPTPLRLQYLDLVLRSHWQQYNEPLAVDGWSIHNFILNEASCDHYNDLQICWGADIPPGVDAIDGLRIGFDENDRFDLFVAQIERFRQWMAGRGYRNTPLYLSEYGILMPPDYGFDVQRVNTFMTQSFDYLLSASNPSTGYPADGNRLVQRFSWYSTNDKTNFNGWLFEKPSESAPYQLSPMGQNYANYVKNITSTVDILPMKVTLNPSAPLSGTGPVSVTVNAQIANSGNLLGATTVKVRFYDGNPTEGGQQIGTDQSVSLIGCGETKSVSVTWKNVAEAEHTVYVEVDPDNLIAEGANGEANNMQQQTLFFATDTVYLPVVSRAFVP